MNAPTMTADEMFGSLTGFEEIAINAHFGAEITDLAEHKPITFVRALVFTCLTRTGQTAQDAKKAAMEMSITQATEYFEADEEEVMADDPTSEPGKGDKQPA
jgi:hypothetical protein